MGKITKEQLRMHEQAEQIIHGSDKKLTRDEVYFCLEHWDPRASSGKHVAKGQAYFTPMNLAMDGFRYVGGNGRRVVDIAAGIGRLAFAVLDANYWNPREVHITAVEINSEYVAIGQRLLPEVEWVQGDLYDLGLWQSLPRFDEAITNPPFGKILTDCDTSWIGYKGPAGLSVASIALKVARLGPTIILPQTQTPYKYSGQIPGAGAYALTKMGYLKKFEKLHPELEWDHRSLDTEHTSYKSGWRGAAPVVEVVGLYDRDAELIELGSFVAEPPPVPRPSLRFALGGI